MSFLKKLFGRGEPAAPKPVPPAAEGEHKGFIIRAVPYQDGGQWQMCGIIEKEIGGETKTHRFIRADKFASAEEAGEPTLAKARLIIDQLGEGLFR